MNKPHAVMFSGVGFRKTGLVLFLLLCLILTGNTAIDAALGDLDPTFGEGGIVKTFVGNRIDRGHVVTVQPDGKVLVAGTSSDYARSDEIVLARYNDDGSLDQDFGEDGRVISDLYSEQRTYGIADMALVESGKFLLLAVVRDYENGGSPAIGLIRFEADGSLDTVFGDNGVVMPPSGSASVVPTSLAVQSDGKLVVAGGTSDGHLTLARFNSDGSLDDTFSGDGFVTGSYAITATDIALQGDGKIVISVTPHTDNFAVARYNSDGSLDTTFGGGYVVTDDGFYNSEAAHAVAVQADGKILAAGYADEGYMMTNRQFAVIRYNDDGSLDSTFSGDGIAMIDFGNREDVAEALIVQADGRIVITGHSGFEGNRDITAARLTADGSLDTSFNGDGRFRDELPGDEESRDAALQQNGSIVIAGYHGQTRTQWEGIKASDIAVVRLNTAGELDGTFGSAGRVLTDFPGYSIGYAVAVQEDGRVLVVGESWNGSENDIALICYLADGSIDSTFGENGHITISFNVRDRARAIVIQPDNKIIVAGDSGDGEINTFAMARFHPDGSLDTSFGNGGKVTTGFLVNYAFGSAVTLQSDGKIVMAGYSLTPGHNNVYALARYNPDGSLDSTFGGDGTVTTALEDTVYSPYLPSMALLPDGKIILASTVSTLTTPIQRNIGLVRYNPDGTLDESFGENGLIVTDLGEDEDVTAIAWQGQRVLVGGINGNLVRFNADGSLDATFGDDGRVVASLRRIYAILPREDGRITVAGYTGNDDNTDLALARFTSDGNVDEAFGSDNSNPGYVITDVSDADMIYGATRQSDHKIIVTGRIDDDGFGILVARYETDPLDLSGVTIEAPAVGAPDTSHTLTAHTTPESATTPLTYQWEATGQAMVTNMGGLTDSVSFSWDDIGPKVITVTVSNSVNTVTTQHNLLIVGDVTTTVTPEEGGTLNYEGTDGSSTTITVAPDAVSSPVTLVYTDVAGLEGPGMVFAGLGFELTAYQNGEPVENFVFQEPVSITLRYTDSAIGDTDEETLRLYVWQNGQWIDAATTCTPPATYTRNPEQNVLVTSVCHLSRFALFGQESTTELSLFLPMVVKP